MGQLGGNLDHWMSAVKINIDADDEIGKKPIKLSTVAGCSTMGTKCYIGNDYELELAYLLQEWQEKVFYIFTFNFVPPILSVIFVVAAPSFSD